jgi:2-dehydropantoate 2-reductase
MGAGGASREVATGTPRVAVLGAGLVGVYVGGRLASAGAPVTLVGRARVLEELRAHGLHLTDWAGADVRLPPEALAPRGLTLTEEPGAVAGADLVLLCVKSPATEEAADLLARHARPGTPVLALQNGVSHLERLRKRLPALRVVAGMVPFNVARRGPGHYHQGTEGSLLAADDAALGPAVRTVFAAAGLPLALRADMPAVLWGKLVINLNNAINALSGLPLVEQLAQRDFRRCLALCQAEALGVLARAGVRTEDATRLPTRALPHLLRLPDALYRTLAARGVRMDPHARSSMADDLERGRPTEVEHLNGEVVRLARGVGRAAPVNARVVAHVHAAEQGAPPWRAADLLADLRAVAGSRGA